MDRQIGKRKFLILASISGIGPISGESVGGSNTQRKHYRRTESTKNITQEIVKTQKNHEEFAVSKRPESDNWELMNFLCNKKRIFLILRQRAALECPTFPVNPSRIPSPRGMNSRDCCLPLNTRNSMGTSGKVFEDQPAPEGSSPSFFMDPKNVASSSCTLRSGNTRNIMRHGEGLRREPQSSTMPTLRFTRKDETWNPLYHTGGTFFKNCMMEVPRCTISELHFRIFQTQVTFNVGESISRPKCV